MNWGALLVTFGLVIPAELPDKTFISCVVMSSRYRPGPVWAGASAALLLQAAIAVVAGRLLVLLPQTTLHAVVAALFILGAAYLLFVPEKKEEEKGVREAAPKENEDEAAAQVGWWKPALSTFGILAIAEFGDLTQILIANLTARFRSTWPVFIGASLAFVLVSGLAVLGGRVILRVVPLAVVRRVSGLALLGLGIYSIVELL